MIFEMGDLIGLQAKQGGSRKGSNFRPIVKKPTTWAKKGGSGPPGPSPHGSAHAFTKAHREKKHAVSGKNMWKFENLRNFRNNFR